MSQVVFAGRDALLSSKPKETVVETPRGTFRLRGFTAAASVALRADYEVMEAEAKEKGEEFNPLPLVLIHTLIDEHGNPLLTKDDIPLLSELQHDVIGPLSKAALLVVGWAVGESENPEKNSETTPS